MTVARFVVRVANVDLRGMALPEIADAESDAARRASHVTQAARATALRRQSSHAWPSAVRLRMVKELALGCSSVQSPKAGMYCSRLLATGAMAGAAITVDLRLACGFARIAAQSGEAAHRFGKQAIPLADEPHVPIVERVGQRR